MLVQNHLSQTPKLLNMNPMFFPRNFLAPNCHSQPIGVRKEKLCGKNVNTGLKFINSQQLHIGTKIGGADIFSNIEPLKKYLKWLIFVVHLQLFF